MFHFLRHTLILGRRHLCIGIKKGVAQINIQHLSLQTENVFWEIRTFLFNFSICCCFKKKKLPTNKYKMERTSLYQQATQRFRGHLPGRQTASTSGLWDSSKGTDPCLRQLATQFIYCEYKGTEGPGKLRAHFNGLGQLHWRRLHLSTGGIRAWTAAQRRALLKIRVPHPWDGS